MKAQVGDRLVKDGSDGRRVCEIIGLQHTDGSPPYVVRWLSDGHIALLYPEPYMRLVHAEDEPSGNGPHPAEDRQADTGRPAAGEPVAARDEAGDPGRSRASGGRVKTARMHAGGLHWPASLFAPRSLTSLWPSRGAT